jgi:hypothetical protein
MSRRRGSPPVVRGPFSICTLPQPWSCRTVRSSIDMRRRAGVRLGGQYRFGLRPIRRQLGNGGFSCHGSANAEGASTHSSPGPWTNPSAGTCPGHGRRCDGGLCRRCHLLARDNYTADRRPERTIRRYLTSAPNRFILHAFRQFYLSLLAVRREQNGYRERTCNRKEVPRERRCLV